MKKIISILLTIVLSLSMVSLTACDLLGGDKIEPEHEHEYLKCLSDENAHWGVCSCSATTEPMPHEDLDGDKKCDTCNYTMPETHTHSYGDYVKNESGHYKECSCGDKTENGAHKDNNTDYVCDVCGYEMERPQSPNPSTPSTPPGPQTPIVPNHPTSGDSSFLDKSAVEIYTNISDNLTKSGNYTFTSKQNVSIDIDLGSVMPSAGMIEGFGTQDLEFKYGYAGNEFYGREKYVITADWTKIPFAPPEEQTVETTTTIYEIVCDDNVIYILSQNNAQANKIKDNGSYEDLQNATGVNLDVKQNRLFVPSNNALSNGYFNMSNDADGGATLTIKISGAEAQAFIEENMKADITALAVSDIVYIVHLDAQGNLEKIDYYFQIYALFNDMLPAYYNYSCTTTITDVDKTVISAPSDIDNYIDADFIK